MQAGTLSGVDIFDEIDRFYVIVELPGVSKEDISVNVKANALKIVALAGARQYHKHIDLGVPVKGDPEIHYNNGVLEIMLGKA
jgi:HSP20 family protein